MRKLARRIFHVALLAGPVLVAPASGQSLRVNDSQAVQSISGERAKAHVVEISRFYREDATPGFQEAVMYIAKYARQYGLSDVRIENFLSDGTTRYFNMRTRYGWIPRSAELWLVEPRQKLADFQEISTNLATWSHGADVTTDVIDIGAGAKAEDFRGQDVRGKIVFTSSPPSAVQEQAVTRRGAAGVISYWSPRSRSSFPDQVNWLDTANNSESVKTFAFVLSRRVGEALKERLRSGPVQVHAIVDADLVAGQLEVLTATIPGIDQDAGEIVLIAHICHFTPSSNDDASGCALLLELARVWQSLIQSGAITRPRRTIRFLWVPENYGTVAYLEAHPEVSRTVKAAIDLDMVGEDEDRCNSVFRIIRTPDSRPSFLADILEKFTEDVANLNLSSPSGTHSTFRYVFNEYVSGSDHVWFNDAGVAVPAVLLTHWPDSFYHTNEDSPDKVDPSELRRVGAIVLSSAQFLSAAGPEEADSLARLVAARGAQRIAGEMARAVGVLSAPFSPGQERAVHNRLIWMVARETAAIRSTSALSGKKQGEIYATADSFHSRQTATVKNFLASSNLRQGGPPQEKNGSLGAVYRRQGRYLSALWKQNLANGKLTAEEAARATRFLSALPYGENSAAELFNLIDGRRTLKEIVEIIEAERCDDYIFEDYFGDGSMTSPPPFPTAQVDRFGLMEFMRLAQKAGLVSLEGAEDP